MTDIKELKRKCEKFSVLCVDDEDETREELKELLEVFFHTVYSAKDGKEAFELYNQNEEKIDLIVTDINMPKMDGITLAQKIKHNNPLECVIVLSAKQDIDIYLQCVNSGVNGIMIKPITAEKLAQTLSQFLIFIKQIESVKQQSCIKPHCEVLQNGSLIFYDHITGLFSKSKLDQYLLSNSAFNIVLVNLDNFDKINCQYGYDIADEVLYQIGQLFLQIAQKDIECTVFRGVSDEFVFLLTNQSNEVLEGLCKNILDSLDGQTIQAFDEQIQISCTIGISSGSGQEALRKAHLAVRESREIGKQKYHFFSSNSTLSQKSENNLKWLKKVKKVLKEDLVVPYYQPIIDNSDDTIFGYESLARVREANRIVKPYYFLENARLFNLMPNITKVMIHKTFNFYQSNKKQKFAINITLEDLSEKKFCPYILKMVDKYNIDTKMIIFEFLESVTISKEPQVFENLNRLKEAGFLLAVDDFGTNHLSIEKLHFVKIDYIKIYNLFIENILEDKKAKKVVESIIQIAQTIGAKTIAESVSSKEIQKKIKKMGVDYSQGFYLGKPKESLL